MKTPFKIAVVTAICSACSINMINAAKPFKSAPEKTIVIFMSKPADTFNANNYPHLDFYYLPNLSYNEADFVTRWNTANSLASPLSRQGKYQSFATLIVDANMVVACQRRYVSNASHNQGCTCSYYNGDYFLTEPGAKDKAPAIAAEMKKYIGKGTPAKQDKKKIYTEGQDPTFKAWKKGNIEGMLLPDFEVFGLNNEKYKIHDVLKGQPSFVVFQLFDYDRGNWGNFPFLVELENALYAYFPQKKK
ncbi:MAG: hypothetical protein PHH37_00095 [Paludibacter sp.]|nr:hypothetical protein [Paludibacter sp.]